MTKSFRSVLFPLLLISYICGLRVVEFPTGHPRLWFSLLYISLLWSVYLYLLTCTVMPYMIHYSHPYFFCYWVNIFIVLMSTVYEVYCDKKFRKCLRKIAIVDNTLKQLGVTTDYRKLQMKIVWLIPGWFMILILMTYGESLWLKHQYNHSIIIAIYVPSILNYCSQINLMSDLIFVTTLGYIGLKFDQINESIQKVAKYNEREKQDFDNIVLHSRQRRLSKTPSSKCITWIVIHLHSELCKISRDINSVFGIQMTLKMGMYFGFIASAFCELFNVILINNYVHETIEYIALLLYWIALYLLKLLLINCVCERISVKANLTGNFINKISYSTCDIEVRENILQLLLQITQSPLKFYGLRLFQFGFKFLHGFSTSVATVLVILVQAHTKKEY